MEHIISGPNEYVATCTSGRPVVLDMSFSDAASSVGPVPVYVLEISDFSWVRTIMANPMTQCSLLQPSYGLDDFMHSNE